jgi:hypothetical protein
MSPKAPSPSKFVQERDAALLSLDQFTIEEYGRKYGVKMSSNPDIFWASVHKARTGAVSLPREARLESKRWLAERGMSSLDDGDLDEEVTP